MANTEENPAVTLLDSKEFFQTPAELQRQTDPEEGGSSLNNIKNPSWWKSRTKLEKNLIVKCIMCAVGIIALCIIIFSLSIRKTADICMSSDCIQRAAEMLQFLDATVDPCDNFYDFACGKFLKDTVIPDDKVSVDAFSVIRDRVQEQLRNVISAPIANDEINPFKMVKRIYSACMNRSLIEERGLKPLEDIHKLMGGWPVIKGDSWNEESWTWQQAVHILKKNGYSTDYIFDFSVGTDLKNSTRRIVDIDQASLGLRREYLIKGFKSPIVDAYHRYEVDMAVLYGANKIRAEKEMRDVLEFEFELADISLAEEERRNFTSLYTSITIEQLQEKHPYNKWLYYFNSILPSVSHLNEQETINLGAPSFFEKLGPLLAKTPKRTLANYFLLRITRYSSTYLTEHLRKRQLEFSTVITGRKEQEPRWKECISLAAGMLPIGTGALYVRKYFKEESKTAALKMVNMIKDEFRSILKTVSWMDDNTRTAALKKVDRMSTHIGFPDELMDDKELSDFYKDLEINENEFLESILEINKFDANREFNRLRETVNRTEWIKYSESAVVNALYSPEDNSIEFPAGILQGKFFAAERPRYLNFGAIGFVIGHEITHGFDDEGSQFDSDGNLIDWWEGSTKDAYLEKARCIIEQYGNFTEPHVNMSLNGINTQGENIADNGGIKEAYMAYQKFVKENGEEPKLPGLDFTPNQLFWISAAHTWCSVDRPETLKMRITTGVHSPEVFRVLGPMSNMPEFSKDFNCPESSKMNPKKKCKVW